MQYVIDRAYFVYLNLLVTYTTCSANMFGANLTGLTLDLISGILFSTRTPKSLQNLSKSLSDRQWMLGELCHLKGNCLVTGALPPNRSCNRQRQCAKLGKLTITLLAMRKSSLKTFSGSFTVWRVCESIA